MSEKEGLKLEPGMILVYTSATHLSTRAKGDMHKVLEAEACVAFDRKPRNLHIGIVILDAGEKLEVLPKIESEPDDTEREQPRTVAEKFTGRCDAAREGIKNMSHTIRHLREHPIFGALEKYPDQHAEMKANIMLAYRHLEDARMRVGKILQAAGDGVSILDKSPQNTRGEIS